MSNYYCNAEILWREGWGQTLNYIIFVVSKKRKAILSNLEFSDYEKKEDLCKEALCITDSLQNIFQNINDLLDILILETSYSEKIKINLQGFKEIFQLETGVYLNSFKELLEKHVAILFNKETGVFEKINNEYSYFSSSFTNAKTGVHGILTGKFKSILNDLMGLDLELIRKKVFLEVEDKSTGVISAPPDWKLELALLRIYQLESMDPVYGESSVQDLFGEYEFAVKFLRRRKNGESMHDEPFLISKKPEKRMKFNLKSFGNSVFDLEVNKFLNYLSAQFKEEKNETEKKLVEVKGAWESINKAEQEKIQKQKADEAEQEKIQKQKADEVEKQKKQKVYEAEQQEIRKKNEPSFFSSLYAFFFYYNCPKCRNQSGISQGSKQETIAVYHDDKSNKNVRIYSDTEFIICRKCNYSWLRKTEHSTHQGC